MSPARQVVSVVVIFKIEVVRDFYVTKQRISTSWGVCRLLGCSRRAPSAALRFADGFLHRREESNFRFVPVAQTQFPSISRRPSLKKSLSSPIMPCSGAFNVRNKVFLTSACWITAKGQVPQDEACRSLRTSTVFGRLPIAVTTN